MIKVSCKPFQISENAVKDLKAALPEWAVGYFRFEKADEEIEALIEKYFEPCYKEEDGEWMSCAGIAYLLKSNEGLKILPSEVLIGKYMTACEYHSKMKRINRVYPTDPHGGKITVKTPQKCYLVKLL